MADAARKRATYQDVLDAPDHIVAEVIDGNLYSSPRPSPRHAIAAIALGGELGPAFGRGRGGPGGWVILFEPELHLRSDILVPDLAGWRRERLTEIPDAAYFELTPDWVCEVLSPATATLDRGHKMAVYRREQVAHVWIVDPLARTLEVYRLDGATYRLIATHTGDEPVRAEPFDAIPLELGLLWKL